MPVCDRHADTRPAPVPGDAFARAHARLSGAGYGAGIARAYRAAAPRVAEHAGIEQAQAIATDASRLAIRARPRMAATFLEVCPRIAARLGTAAGFARWRATIAAVLAQCPAATGAIVTRSDWLLDRLGLEAFAAWTRSGLRVAGRDPALALSFFQLDTAEARRLLARHAGELTFPDLKAGLIAYHTALWGAAPRLREAAPDDAHGPAPRSTFAGDLIVMPSAYPGFDGRERQVYRAALAHIGAHRAFGAGRAPVGPLKPLQITLISLIEDARVETLAMRDMPGLARLWRPFHTAPADGLATAPALFAMLARGLIDPDFRPAHAWVRKGVALFAAHAWRLDDPAISWEIGNALGNDLGQARVQFDPRNHVVEPAYRDDNLGLWDVPDDPDAPPPPHELDISPAEARRPPPGEATDRGGEPPSGPDSPGRARRAEAAAQDGAKLMSLPEYDYHAGGLRDDWVQVTLEPPVPGDAGYRQDLLERHGLAGVRAAVPPSASGPRRRLRRQAEGEGLDLEAVLDAAIARRARRQPDANVYARVTPPARSIAVHLVLDVSRSTGDPVGHDGRTVLDMERDAAALLAGMMAELGDELAICAFSSRGRFDVRTTPIKPFGAPLDDATFAALSGLRPAYSTRIGAALRMAAAGMADVARYRKLVLLITDGAPSDIDVPDPEYLVADARYAVQAMRAQGIDAVCVALGPEAGQRQSEIFGRRSCLRIRDVATLPATLSDFYLRVTR